MGMVYAGQFLLPLYLMKGCGLSVIHAGWALAPMGIGMMCTYPLMGFFTEKFGCRKVAMSGILLSFVGTVPFFWMIKYDYSAALMMFSMFIRGVGQGATGLPAVSAAYASLPREKLPNGTTATNIAQRLGGPVATTFMALVISSSASFFPATGPHSFYYSFFGFVGSPNPSSCFGPWASCKNSLKGHKALASVHETSLKDLLGERHEFRDSASQIGMSSTSNGKRYLF